MKKTIAMWVALYCFITITAQETQERVAVQVEVQQRTASSGSSNSSESSGGLSDLVLPKNSPFQLGENIEGTIQSSINKATGKVIFSIPISSISANTVGYSVALTYNGAITKAMAKNTNEFTPTSVAGVGFSMGIPKIIADYKNTAVRDDDTFYLADGNYTKLICTKRTDTYLEFKTEKHTLWKITYYKGNTGLNEDYWEVIKEDGTIYQFGENGQSSGNNAKSYVSRWGNWIGDSNQTPTGVLTTAWNIYQIKDQWNNNITFSYEKIQGKQNASQSNFYHTEAIYLKEIQSSNNSKITFTYGNKIPQEYYEPHIEQSEPDAYQEQYEKKYLQQVQTYNTNNELIFTYKLDYELRDHTDPTKPHQAKRYLKRFIQENKSGEALPGQEFTYHTSGDFKGRIHEIIYPMGGKVTYNYTKKTLFYNNANRFTGSQLDVSDYYLMASYNAGSYVLDLYRSKNIIRDNLYRYKMIRHHWTGSQWNRNEYTYPHLLPYKTTIYGADRYLDGFQIVYGEDYYGMIKLNRISKEIYLRLFHLSPDGKTWSGFSQTLTSIECSNEEPYTEDPVFLNGENFVVIGTKKSGELRTFTWNGESWNYKYIDQGDGEYYYAARNNFILALNEDGGVDLSLAGNPSYADNYYFHYVDNEKTWHTKSWSQVANQQINSIEAASTFFPSNAMTAFVAEDNPEYFLRWDIHYNLVGIDNVLGYYNDATPIYNPSTGFFTLGGFRSYSIGSPSNYLYKLARFRGNGWSTNLNYSYGDRISSLAYGKDLLLYANQNKQVSYSLYNLNTNSWKSQYFLTANSLTPNMETSLFGNFLLLDEVIYKKNRNPFSIASNAFSWLETTPEVVFSTTNGLNYLYTSSVDGVQTGTQIKTRLYYPNKTNTGISSINFDEKFGMKGMQVFGGYQKFLSGNSIYLRSLGSFNGNTNQFYPYLYRVINGKVNEDIEDIVVDFIEIDNQLDPVRKIQYEFDQYVFLPNGSAYYGKSTTQHKGYGNANNGKVVTFSNTGTTDMRLLGTPIKTEVRDANDVLKSETLYTHQVFDKTHYNVFNTPIGKSYYVRTTEKTENSYEGDPSNPFPDFEDYGTLNLRETYAYNSLGLLEAKTVHYDTGKSVVTNTTYAHEIYSFLEAKNIVSKPAKIIQKKNNEVMGTSEVIWKEESGKVFPYKTLAGVATTKVLTEITQVNDLGLTEEESNGKGIYNVNLLGYNKTYAVASINNARYSEVIAALDVSYESLQTLDTEALKTTLLKLYTALPKASITLSFYDNNGNVTSKIDTRKEEVHYFYDAFHRLVYVQDAQGNKLTQTEYHFKE